MSFIRGFSRKARGIREVPYNNHMGALLAKQLVSSALKLGKPSNVARVKF